MASPVVLSMADVPVLLDVCGSGGHGGMRARGGARLVEKKARV